MSCICAFHKYLASDPFKCRAFSSKHDNVPEPAGWGGTQVVSDSIRDVRVPLSESHQLQCPFLSRWSYVSLCPLSTLWTPQVTQSYLTPGHRERQAHPRSNSPRGRVEGDLPPPLPTGLTQVWSSEPTSETKCCVRTFTQGLGRAQPASHGV